MHQVTALSLVICTKDIRTRNPKGAGRVELTFWRIRDATYCVSTKQIQNGTLCFPYVAFAIAVHCNSKEISN